MTKCWHLAGITTVAQVSCCTMEDTTEGTMVAAMAEDELAMATASYSTILHYHYH